MEIVDTNPLGSRTPLAIIGTKSDLSPEGRMVPVDHGYSMMAEIN